MTTTLKALRARFPQYHVNKTIGGDFCFGLKGVSTKDNDYAFISVRNTEYQCGVTLFLYPTKGKKPVRFAEQASYKSWHALKREFVKNGVKSKELPPAYLKNQMTIMLEGDLGEVLDILEAHMADVLYKQQWMHAYLVSKNRELFGYDDGTINLRHMKEFGNDVQAAESAPETEAVESCVGVDPARARFVQDFTGGLAKVVLSGATDLDMARCINEAVRVYESSYDNVGADAETKRVADANDALRAKAAETGRELSLSEMQWGFYEKYQRLTIREAVEAVVPAQLVQPVYLLIKYTWNESLDWANEILKAEEV